MTTENQATTPSNTAESTSPDEDTLEYQLETELGRPEKKINNTKFNIAQTPDRFSPYIDWYYDVPVLYIYDEGNNEPAFAIALPTEETPEAKLIQQGEWTDSEWFDNH